MSSEGCNEPDARRRELEAFCANVDALFVLWRAGVISDDAAETAMAQLLAMRRPAAKVGSDEPESWRLTPVINDTRLRGLHATVSKLVASGIRMLDVNLCFDGEWYSMKFAPCPGINPGYESIPTDEPSV